MPKLTIGAVGDKYEQEADAVAAQVVQQLNSPQPIQREEYEDEKSERLQQQSLIQSIQRTEGYEDEDEEEIRMKPLDGVVQRTEGYEDEEEEIRMQPLVQLKEASAGGAASPELEQSIQQERGKGQPLAESIRQPMENAFGANFGNVRIHTDNTADQLNQSIQAKAFTTGQDVFFRQGAYAPESQGGQELLAHELTHVVQQNGIQSKVNLSKASPQSEQQNGQAIQPKHSSVTPNFQRFKEDQSDSSLLELAHTTYPTLDHEPINSAPSPNIVVQCAWDTHLLDYATMSQEKQQGQIRTGKLKGNIFNKQKNTLTKLTANFRTALEKSDENKALGALNKLLARLQSDQTSAAQGKLKAPKNVKSKDFDKTAAQQAAATFFQKWIQVVQEHIAHTQQAGDWIYDFRQKYIFDPQAANMTPKEQILANVQNIENANEQDLEAVGIMWDRGDQAQQQRMMKVMGGVNEMRRMSGMEYFLEQVSPVNLGYGKVRELFNFWSQGVLYHNLDWEWQTWMPNRVEKSDAVIDSYDAVERAQYKLTPQGKKIKKANSQPLVGDNIYVLTKDNEWYGGAKNGPVHHSSFMQGAPVKCAGHLHTDNQGKLLKIDISSGHYTPNQSDLKRALAVLGKQMDISGVNTGGFI
ncbi:MAG: DUF4157 domain-containing protein [Spirulina sp. SIO3F2]|nr:DUF4157 domain-containing protein [Spirulina sp. SIO3F2]